MEGIDELSKTENHALISDVSNLLPCPFCGGKVVEEKPHWNMANAKCTKCNNEWGHCGSKYEGRFDKWNKRAM